MTTPYKCYRLITAHRNVKFNYGHLLYSTLFALGLLEKSKMRAVELYFPIDAVEVYTTTKMGHVLTSFKIINRDTKFLGMNELIFQYDTENFEDGKN